MKGGGHTSNPGFSSTTGVQISLDNFSDVVYDQDAGTVTIGASYFTFHPHLLFGRSLIQHRLVWDEVYLTLEPHGITVLGGRVPSVGVAGLLLGGG